MGELQRILGIKPAFPVKGSQVELLKVTLWLKPGADAGSQNVPWITWTNGLVQQKAVQVKKKYVQNMWSCMIFLAPMVDFILEVHVRGWILLAFSSMIYRMYQVGRCALLWMLEIVQPRLLRELPAGHLYLTFTLVLSTRSYLYN